MDGRTVGWSHNPKNHGVDWKRDGKGCASSHTMFTTRLFFFSFSSLEETFSVGEIAAPLVPVPVLYPGKKTSVVQPFFMGFQFYKKQIRNHLVFQFSRSHSRNMVPGRVRYKRKFFGSNFGFRFQKSDLVSVWFLLTWLQTGGNIWLMPVLVSIFFQFNFKNKNQ